MKSCAIGGGSFSKQPNRSSNTNTPTARSQNKTQKLAKCLKIVCMLIAAKEIVGDTVLFIPQIELCYSKINDLHR